MGLLHGSSLYSPAAPAGNVTGCTAEDVGKNLHRRSDVYGKHTPGNYGCGCATPGTERNKHCKNNNSINGKPFLSLNLRISFIPGMLMLKIQRLRNAENKIVA